MDESALRTLRAAKQVFYYQACTESSDGHLLVLNQVIYHSFMNWLIEFLLIQI